MICKFLTRSINLLIMLKSLAVKKLERDAKNHSDNLHIRYLLNGNKSFVFVPIWNSNTIN